MGARRSRAIARVIGDVRSLEYDDRATLRLWGELVRVHGADTRFTPYDRSTGASRSTTIAGLAVLSAALWILTPHFMTVSNLLNVAEQTSINAIVAVFATAAGRVLSDPPPETGLRARDLQEIPGDYPPALARRSSFLGHPVFKQTST